MYVIIFVFGISQNHILLPHLQRGGAICPCPNCCLNEKHDIFISEPRLWICESRLVVSDSLQPHGLLQSMEFSGPEYWSGWPFPSPTSIDIA